MEPHGDKLFVPCSFVNWHLCQISIGPLTVKRSLGLLSHFLGNSSGVGTLRCLTLDSLKSGRAPAFCPLLLVYEEGPLAGRPKARKFFPLVGKEGRAGVGKELARKTYSFYPSQFQKTSSPLDPGFVSFPGLPCAWGSGHTVGLPTAVGRTADSICLVEGEGTRQR